MSDEHNLSGTLRRETWLRRTSLLPLQFLAAPRKVLLKRAYAQWQENAACLDEAGWRAACSELCALGRARPWHPGEPIAGYIAPVAIRFAPLRRTIAASPAWAKSLGADCVEAWAGADLDELAATVHRNGGRAQLDSVERQIETEHGPLMARFDRLLLPYRLPKEEIGLAILSQMHDLRPADQMLSFAP